MTTCKEDNVDCETEFQDQQGELLSCIDAVSMSIKMSDDGDCLDRTVSDGNDSDGNATDQQGELLSCSDAVSMSIKMSDDGDCLDRTVSDGNDSDGNSTDSSTDSVPGSKRGIHIMVHYKMKIAKKDRKFTKPLYIDLPFERYLKWKFIMRNKYLCPQKVADIQQVAENAKVTEEVIEIYLGRCKDNQDFNVLRDDIETKCLANTESIAISFFPIRQSYDIQDVYQVLTETIQQGDTTQRPQMYAELGDGHMLQIVHDLNDAEQVSEIVQRAIRRYAHQMISNQFSQRMAYPLVYHKILEKLDLKTKASEMFPSFDLYFDITESDGKFSLVSCGPGKQIHEIRDWIQSTFINKYHYQEVGFDEIKGYMQAMDIPYIIKETLDDGIYTDLHWTVDKFSKKIHLCSLVQKEVDQATNSVKNCLQQDQKNLPDTIHEAEAIAGKIVQLAATNKNLLDKGLTLKFISDSQRTLMYLHGSKGQVKSIDGWVAVHAKEGNDTQTGSSASDTKTSQRDKVKWKTEQAEFSTHGSMNLTNNYLLVKDIPPEYTESDLEDDVKDCYPKLQYSTIFVPGMSEAIIKCKDKKDTKQLVDKESKSVRFTHFPAQIMMQFSTTIEYAVGEKTVQSLREKDIEAKVKAGKTYVTAPTELQYKYALVKLEKTKSYSVGTRENSEGFKNSIEVTVNVWDIVETLKDKEITKLRQQGKEVSYHEGYIMFSDQKGKSEDPHWTVVKSCLDSLKRMQMLEVTITEGNVEKIKKWCQEIERDQAKQCCVFVPKRSAIFLFDDSYENLQKFKHQLLIKDGQIKVVGRRKRMFNDMNPVFPAGKESEPHNSDSNILPVVEGESKPCNDWNQEDREKQILGKRQEFNLKLQAKNLQVYATAESIKVCVYEANILKLPVNCIVNAANDTLHHGGGIAKVIAVAAGSRLNKEGYDYIGKHGKIPVGKTCVTTAGNLHYDCVIHAVGPRWSDYSPHSLYDVQRCEEDLYSAVMESFLAAEKRGLKSIALPTISAAIFGVPEELCVYHYAKATIDYSKKMSPKALKEIHFIDINSNIVRSIQNMFDAFLRYKRSPDYSTDKFVRTAVKPYRPRSKSPDRTEHRGRDTDTEIVYTYYKDDFRHIIDTEKCRLVIQHGDIMQVKAAAIVSIEDLRGSGRGKFSKLIEGKIEGLDKNKYLKSKKQLFSTDQETGDVIVTDGFNSGYQYILHAVLPHDVRNFHPVDRENTIKQTLQKILEALDGQSIHSLVMCLLGAGEETKDEIGVAAVAFIKTFKTYCEQRKSGQSKHLEIKLVCKQENILKWVLEKFRDYGIIQDCTERAPALPPRPAKKSENLTEDLDNRESLEDCVICMEKITKRKVLKCGNAFDKGCIKQAVKVKKVCPTCGMICGKLKGDQPDGKMKVNIETYSHCAGYEQYGRISITYTFPSGKQGPDHPNPGKHYQGITRIAYLPDNDEGNEVLAMLRLAFDRKLTFTIGTSRTTGEEGVITWNDIHHKTDPRPKTQFGYPDPTYLERVKDDLAAKGITPEDIRKTH